MKLATNQRVKRVKKYQFLFIYLFIYGGGGRRGKLKHVESH